MFIDEMPAYAGMTIAQVAARLRGHDDYLGDCCLRRQDDYNYGAVIPAKAGIS